MSTSQKISVTLNGPSDWVEVMKALALASKVWDYIDPSKDEAPALEEPKPPQPKDINDQISTFNSHRRNEKSIAYSDKTISGNGTYMTDGTMP